MEQNETTLDHIKTHADAVIHFIKNLDINMVDDLLDEKYKYLCKLTKKIGKNWRDN
jgi:kynurenine formamidase